MSVSTAAASASAAGGAVGDRPPGGERLLQFGEVEEEGLSVFHHRLPAEEIHPLDPRRSLVDRVDPDVAVVLFEREFVAVAVAAQALEPLAHREDPHLRGIALGDGGEEVEKELVAFLFRCTSPETARDASRELSLHHKRTGRWPEATAIWEEMLRRGGNDRFALVELAKWYEHKRRDFDRALELTERACASADRVSPEESADLIRRRERLERKLAARDVPPGE